MRIGLKYITPVLAAGAAAVAIAAAPTAAAASTQSSCTDVGGSATLCQSPGNVQLNDSPPVDFAPLYPYWEGSYGGYGGYGGGMHGGGMGGGGHR
jgi:hypothetical protein